jgi:hypothetical protein
MNTPLSILEAYNSNFREMINEKNISSDGSVRELFRLNKEEDWDFICTAMDVVGDTSLAIENFLEYSLDGPAKNDDIGEKYLRLYGVLNAVYMQHQAITTLYKRNNVPNPKEVRRKIKKLKIRVLRHKLASHSVEYLNPITRAVETYVLNRATLGGFYCEIMNNETLELEQVDLKLETEKHLSLMVEIYDKIYEKSIETFFRGNQKKQQEYLDHLKNLRMKRKAKLATDCQ